MRFGVMDLIAPGSTEMAHRAEQDARVAQQDAAYGLQQAQEAAAKRNTKVIEDDDLNRQQRRDKLRRRKRRSILGDATAAASAIQSLLGA